MSCAGALSKTSLIFFKKLRTDWQTRSIQFSRWRALLGSMLGALLLSASAQASPIPASELAPAASVEAELPHLMEDGVYFFGQVPQPHQVGASYMVFEAQDEQLIGAIFMENSSFDCFEGQLDGGQLSLQITNSYTREAYPYAIALATVEEPVASADAPPTALQLEGFYDLGTAGGQQLAILETCRSDSLPKAELEI